MPNMHEDLHKELLTGRVILNNSGVFIGGKARIRILGCQSQGLTLAGLGWAQWSFGGVWPALYSLSIK